MSNITNVVHTARLATGLRVSMPRERRIDLMGAARPQTSRRSTRQAFGGTQKQRKQTKTKTLRNPQNFSYEVSHLRGHRNAISRYFQYNLP